jgi:hypothetical protein
MAVSALSQLAAFIPRGAARQSPPRGARTPAWVSSVIQIGMPALHEGPEPSRREKNEANRAHVKQEHEGTLESHPGNSGFLPAQHAEQQDARHQDRN